MLELRFCFRRTRTNGGEARFDLAFEVGKRLGDLIVRAHSSGAQFVSPSCGFTTLPKKSPTIPPSRPPAKATIRSSPPNAPMRPNEKTRTVAMKPSMKAAKTEHTAPEIMPTTMSPSRQYTLDAFPARLTVSSLQAMRELAAELARHVRPGDVIAVEGALGSGKTAFVGGLAEALVGGDPVTSPTFTFWHRYGNGEVEARTPRSLSRRGRSRLG